MRLVPSLSGSLYRFCGDALEPLPLSADQLLSSSHKYSDDLVVAGNILAKSILILNYILLIVKPYI